MSHPVHATVQATQSCVVNVTAACESLLPQDVSSAVMRYATLLAMPELRALKQERQSVFQLPA